MPDHDLAALLEENLALSRRAVGLITLLLASLGRKDPAAKFVIASLSIRDLRQTLTDRQNDDETLLAAYRAGRDEGRAAGHEAGHEAGLRAERAGLAGPRRVVVPGEPQELARWSAVLDGNLELSLRAIGMVSRLFVLLGRTAPEAEFVFASLSIRDLRLALVSRRADEEILLAAYHAGRDEGRAAGYENGYEVGRRDGRSGWGRLRLAASQ